MTLFLHLLTPFVFVEGSWDRVHQVIGQAHTIIHQKGVVRIHTDVRVGTRYPMLLAHLILRNPFLLANRSY